MSWRMVSPTLGALEWADGAFTGEPFLVEMVERLVRRAQPVPTFAQGPFVPASADEDWVAWLTAKAALEDFVDDATWSAPPPVPEGLLAVPDGAVA